MSNGAGRAVITAVSDYRLQASGGVTTRNLCESERRRLPSFYFAPGAVRSIVMGVYVCLSVCIFRNHTAELRKIFFACWLWLRLGSPLAALPCVESWRVIVAPSVFGAPLITLNDHFNGQGSAIGPLCLSVCLNEITVDVDMQHSNSTRPNIRQICRSRS